MEARKVIKYYILIFGVWVRVTEKIYYKCNRLWRKMSCEQKGE